MIHSKHFHYMFSMLCDSCVTSPKLHTTAFLPKLQYDHIHYLSSKFDVQDMFSLYNNMGKNLVAVIALIRLDS